MVDGSEIGEREESEAPLSLLAEVAPAVVALAALWAVSLWAWPKLPDQVPTHWGISGQPDAWGSRAGVAFGVPALFTGIVGLVVLLSRPALDFRFAGRMDPRVRRLVICLTALLFVSMHGLVLVSVLRGELVFTSARLWIPLGLFFILLGNYLPRLEPNQWVGIRIPPTLEDRRVWKSTHRFAAPFFMGAGFIQLLVGLLPPAPGNWIGMGVIAIACGLPIIHAYRFRHRLS